MPGIYPSAEVVPSSSPAASLAENADLAALCIEKEFVPVYVSAVHCVTSVSRSLL